MILTILTEAFSHTGMRDMGMSENDIHDAGFGPKDESNGDDELQ